MLRVLFVGNSFTFANAMPQQLADLVAADGARGPMEFTLIAPPGETLEGHWNTPTTRTAIRDSKWDYVVLQEQSTRPFEEPGLFLEYARLLSQEIRETGAEPLFFLTWARRDQPEKQAALTAAYRTAAGETAARVVPVGLAWQAALAAMPSLGLHESDGSHPNLSGSYLAACVFFATLVPKSPEGRPNNYRLADADARFLQRIAWETVVAERFGTTRYNPEDWVSPKVEIRTSAIDGKGTFAREPIRAGEVITVWGGPLFTVDEIRAGKARRDRLVGIVKVGAGLCMGTPQGGEAGATDYLNHSCDPNIGMNDEVTLTARRDICVGEELTADYAMWSDDPSWVAPWACRCGSSLCRRTITGNDWQLPELRERYRGHFSPAIGKGITELHRADRDRTR